MCDHPTRAIRLRIKVATVKTVTSGFLELIKPAFIYGPEVANTAIRKLEDFWAGGERHAGPNIIAGSLVDILVDDIIVVRSVIRRLCSINSARVILTFIRIRFFQENIGTGAKERGGLGVGLSVGGGTQPGFVLSENWGRNIRRALWW